jgi:hypothetical protein
MCAEAGRDGYIQARCITMEDSKMFRWQWLASHGYRPPNGPGKYLASYYFFSIREARGGFWGCVTVRAWDRQEIGTFLLCRPVPLTQPVKEPANEAISTQPRCAGNPIPPASFNERCSRKQLTSRESSMKIGNLIFHVVDWPPKTLMQGPVKPGLGWGLIWLKAAGHHVAQALPLFKVRLWKAQMLCIPRFHTGPL